MNTKKLLAGATLLAIIVFFVSLTLTWAIPQVAVGMPSETRREALVRTMSSMQTEDGSFSGVYQTCRAIMTLQVLRSLDRVNLTKAVDYVVSQQNRTSGGFLDSYLVYAHGELTTPFGALNALKSVNSSSRLDRSLIDFVMLRYNETDGAFHEPTFELNGEKVAWCYFDMVYHGLTEHTAYGHSNVISTFLAVDILRNLDALDRINKTKTTNWILSCRAENGGFGPYPNPHGEPYAPYWTTNPFTVDTYGAGVAYTYAAVGALTDLDHIDSLTSEEQELARDYILSCQHGSGCFVSIPEYAAVSADITPEDSSSEFTFYALTGLQYLNNVNQSGEHLMKAEKWILNQQYLQDTDTYGLFSSLSPIGGAYDAVLSLNASGGLYLLDELTPRALERRALFLSISSAMGFTTFATVVASLTRSNGHRTENKNKKHWKAKT